MFPVGGGNSLLFGFQDCSTVTSTNSFDVQPYVVTTTTLISSVPTSTYGERVLFTVTVTAQGFPVPDAAVTLEDLNEAAVLGIATTLNGATTLHFLTLRVGTLSIRATYTPTTPAYLQGSSSSPLFFDVTDPFVGAFFELKNLATLHYVISDASQGLTEGSLFYTWDLGLSAFSDHTREQFAFQYNGGDRSYVLTSQEAGSEGTLYCMKWVDGIHSNPNSATDSHGSVQSSTDCAGDASKWFFIPVSMSQGLHWQIKNKASETCMYPVDGGNSILFGFQDCSTVTSTNSFDVQPYVVTTTTLTSSVSTAKYGATTTFTATITAQGFSVPDAAVTFHDLTDSKSLHFTVSTNGVASLLSYSLTVGTHTISATYLGAATYFHSSTSNGLDFTVTDAFIEPFYAFKNVEFANYIISSDSLDVLEGSLFETRHSDENGFNDYLRQQFALIKNSDLSYTLINQEPDVTNTLYCMKWINGVHSNPYSLTEDLGSIISSTSCDGDDAKWFFNPVNLDEGVYWQVKNKASGTCMGPIGGGDSLLFGFAECDIVSPLTAFDIHPYDVTFTNGLQEIKNIAYQLYVISLADYQGLAEGSLFYTWYQGLGDFTDHTREQFAFSRSSDGTYLLTNQEHDSNGVLYCMKWIAGVQSNAYSSTDSNGAAASTTDCSSDSAKWIINPVHLSGILHYQIKNKASASCLYPVGNGNSLLFGFQSCETVSPVNSWEILPYEP